MLRNPKATRRYGIERREFLHYVAAVSAIPTIAMRAEGQITNQPRFEDNPFTLGVASGDPEPDGVVIWTRLDPTPLVIGGTPSSSGSSVADVTPSRNTFITAARRGKSVRFS